MGEKQKVQLAQFAVAAALLLLLALVLWQMTRG